MRSQFTYAGGEPQFVLNWPYLRRSHVFALVNGAARSFTWVDDSTVRVEPLFDGDIVVFRRITPTDESLVKFKDASNLTAEDLNTARLQVLYALQELIAASAGGSAGWAEIGNVINLAAEDINSLIDVHADVEAAMAQLTANLQTLDDLTTEIGVVSNTGADTRQKLLDEITARDDQLAAIVARLGVLEVNTSGFGAQVTQETVQRVTADEALAARVDSVDAAYQTADSDIKAQVTTIEAALTTADEALAERLENVTASVDDTRATLDAVIEARASDKKAIVNDLRSLYANVYDEIGGELRALINEESRVRAEQDEAAASTLQTVQASLTTATNKADQAQADVDALSTTVASVQTQASSTVSKLDGALAQWTLKTQAQRSDGKVVFAGIGVASVANDTVQQSEIVMVADRLVFVPSNDINATPKPIMAAGLVNGSPTLVLSSATYGDKTFTARMLVDGIIEARHLVANSITADKIDARGLVIKDAAGNVVFGAGTGLDYSMVRGAPIGKNLLPNSEQTTCSWVRGWTPNGAKFDREPQLSSAIWADTYRLVGGSTQSIAFHQSTNNTTSSGDGESFRGRYVACDAYFGSNSWDPRSTGMVPVIPGQRIIASVYGATHRCDISIRCVVVDKTGASLSIASNNYAFDTATSTDILGNFTRMSVAFDAPSGAAAVKLFVRKFDSNGTDSWVWLAAPQIEVGSAGQTQPSPYQPGPAMNSGVITPDNASTYIASAAIGSALIANVIQSDNYAAGTSGWMIRKSDGYAEFGNVRVRGDIMATSIYGTIVDTGNIQANAVTTVGGTELSTAVTAATTETTALAMSVTVPTNGSSLIMAVVRLSASSNNSVVTTTTVRLYINGVLSRSQSLAPGIASTASDTMVFVVPSTTSGTVTAEIRVIKNNIAGGGSVGAGSSLSILVGKR